MSLKLSERKSLLAAAQSAARQAYCPYSRFPVGAAVLCDNGEVIAGCNVENASSGLTICAERAALFTAVRAGHRHFRAVLIYTPTPTPTAPCGACRQVLNEFAEIPVVLCCCDGPDQIETSLAELLPHAFGPANLS